MPNTIEKSTRMIEAEERLAFAVAQSQSISEFIERLQRLQGSLNRALGELDIPREREQFFEASLDAFVAWSDGGKIPSARALLARMEEARLFRGAYDFYGQKLMSCDVELELAGADELTARAKILRLQSQEASARAAVAIGKIRDELGENAVVGVENGRAAELERNADNLLLQAASLRNEAKAKREILREVAGAIRKEGAL